MSRIRGRDTKPELDLRKAVWRHGARFRCNVRTLPGWPDLASKSARVAVFVDGCFWHKCPKHYRIPKTRTEFWTKKVSRNVEKRAETLASYDASWTVFEFFECEVRERLEAIAADVAAAFLKAS